MKIMTFLISFYFLALNLVPCNDVNMLQNEISSIVNTENHNGDHEHSSSDLCSPFCHCHCCHTHTIEFGVLEFETLPLAMSQRVFTNILGSTNDFLFSILQPPRV
ncbi:DUF6660 family protein [Ulvibacter antarcticus]|uniref:Uncharacterized protein n=1 Tax=Ulvibacter antarcticus TaxID=442714 RepID=A0A3L9Y9B8_9FLAO|nr:DUF6660 family protein [Ulvibacter antarcticus]RMA57293.1 hypothetical protein BXY75_3181 [Ulvibacter antarcticus]